MVQGAKILLIICKVHMSKYTDGERSLSTLVMKTYDFVEYFLANDLFWYKCIEYKIKC